MNKYRKGSGLRYVLFAVLMIMGTTIYAADPSSPLRVGLAAESILPTEPVQLGGYGLRTGKSEGVRSDIFARVLYLEQGDRKVVWIVCDLIGFDEDLVKAIQNRLSKQCGVPADHIVLSATHTHTAPATMNIGCPEIQNKYIAETLIPNMEQALARAIRSVEPCEIVKAEGYCEIAHDRRNDPVPGDGGAPHADKSRAWVDYRVPAIGFIRKDGTFKGVLVQYVMHPTSWSDLMIGSEWPGTVCKAIQKCFGDKVEPFVVQGGAGNAGSPKRQAPQEEIQTWGDAIVASFAEQLKRAPVPSTSQFNFVTSSVFVPMASMSEDEVRTRAQQYRQEFKDTPCVINKVIADWERLQLERVAAGTADQVAASTNFLTFNDCVFITTPFESFCHLIREIMTKAKGDFHLVGYTNGLYNYLPNAEAFEQGGYEPNSFFWFGRFGMQKGALEIYAQKIITILNEQVLVSRPCSGK